MVSLLEKIYLNKKNIFFILISSVFWISLGTKLQWDENNLHLHHINNLRYLLPYFLLTYFIFHVKNYFNHFSSFNIIIYIIFFSFLFGYVNLYFLNDEYIQKFNIDLSLFKTGYLPSKFKDLFMCFSFIVVFIILNKCQKNELKIINNTNYVFLVLASLFTIVFAYTEFFTNNNSYLYYTNFLVEGEMLGVATIRSLGLGRNLVLIAIPIIIYFFLLKEKKSNYIVFLILIFISTNIFQLQSRTSIYFFYLFIFLVVIYQLIKKNYKDLIIIILITILLPNIFSYSMPHIKSFFFETKIVDKPSRIFTWKPNYSINKKTVITVDKENDEDKGKEKEFKIKEIEEEEISNEIIINTYSSGRLNLWKNAIDFIISEKKIPTLLFGFGPSSDRYFIKESLSNSIIYSFFSGGLLGVIGLILFYLVALKEILIYFYSKKISNDIFYGLTSIFVIFFIFLRSLVETSFLIYGTDHLILISNLCLLRILNEKSHTN